MGALQKRTQRPESFRGTRVSLQVAAVVASGTLALATAVAERRYLSLSLNRPEVRTTLEHFGSSMEDSKTASSQGIIYGSRPGHMWDRVFSLFFTREARDGTRVGGDIIDPYLWGDTRYLLRGESHELAIFLLRQFLDTRADGEIHDLLRRAMFQRDLMAVADWLRPKGNSDDKARYELRNLIGDAIRRLALTSDAIRTLTTDPRAISVGTRTSSIPEQLTESVSNVRELFGPDSPWVCLGDRLGNPIAPTHLRYFDGRSLFYVCITTAQGRRSTLAYLSSLTKLLADSDTKVDVTPARSMMLVNMKAPVGLRTALVRTANVMDRDGNLINSGLVESAHIFSYVAGSDGVVVPAPDLFELRRVGLFAGRGRLVAVGYSQLGHSTFITNGPDPFDRTLSGDVRPGHRILEGCRRCHDLPGLQSVLTLSRERFASGHSLTLRSTALAEETLKQLAWLGSTR